MKKIRLFAALLFLLIPPAPCGAQQPLLSVSTATPSVVPTTTATPAPGTPATPALTLAPIATQLGQTIQTLVGVPSTQPTPATAADNGEDASPPITDTFATVILNTLLQTFETLKKNSAAFETNSAALPDLTVWFQHQFSDPHRQLLWHAIGNDLLVIVGIPLLGSVAFSLLLLPLRLNGLRRQPQNHPEKIFILLSLLALRLLPVIAFLGASLLLLDQNESHNLPRFVILNVIYALTVSYSVYFILRAVFAPAAEQLRPFPFTTARAAYACRWVSAFTIIITCGYFFIDVAAALRIPDSAITLFQNILSFTLTIMAVTVIIHTRARVAAILRGRPEPEEPSFGHALRSGLAHRWHQLAIAYLVVGFAITILGIDNGFALMLRGTILTLVILLLSRLCFLFIDRWKNTGSDNTALIHRQILSFLLRPLMWIVAAVAIAAVWGLHVGDVIATPFGQKMSSAFVSVVLTLLILTVIYEMLNTTIDRHLNRRDKVSKAPVASARARTLLPMVRNTAFILFCAITILTLLSAIGVNIAPVLAGAGVLGVAIGFGSQSLVKDFLTGLFIVVENTVAVGDVVKIGDFGGVVEALSIRTIRLRDTDGSLHILPFSEVSKITNMTKDFAFALVDIGVAYDSDIDHVMQIIRDVGAKLQEDPLFKRVILEAIEVMGIETLGDSAITIRARIRTRPGKQWDVRRLLLQRIKEQFEVENITIPYPTVTHITKAESAMPVPPPPAP